MIHHCLNTLVAAPSATATGAHRGLSELLPSLPSPLALDAPQETPPQSGEQTLSLIATAQMLLSQLEANESSSPIPWEIAGRVRHTLEQLSLETGEGIRREKANQVRGLYVIIDPQVTGGREPLDIAVAAVNGGARMLQLRDKLRDKGESLPLAAALQDLCQRNGALLIINDHADIAAAVGSGGLHVGQTDLPVAQARQILAPHQVLGRSNREFEQLVESKEMGADHVAFGAIYATTSKGVARNPQGPGRVREAKDYAGDTPLVAIGGINLSNVAPVVEAGADAICVTAAVGAAEEPESAAAQMTAAIEFAGGRV
jgi:thiamine-phosphate pyrophosphorylase